MAPESQSPLEFTVAQTRAVGGAVWSIDPQGTCRLLTQTGLGPRPLDQLQSQWAGHAEKLVQVAATGEAASLVARVDGTPGPGRELRLALVPIRQSDGTPLIVELFLINAATPTLESIAGIVQGIFAFSASPGQFSDQTDAPFTRWLSEIHSSLEMDRFCLTLANETQVWSGWDRVSVAIDDGTRFRIQAISGLETFDRRSGAVRELEHLLTELRTVEQVFACEAGEVVTATADADCAQAMRTYSARVQALGVVLLPLMDNGATGRPRRWGAVVTERFTASSTSRPWNQFAALGPYATRALSHARELDHARSGLLTRWTRGQLRRPAWATLLGWGLFSVLELVLTRLDTELVITGRGTMRPKLQRDVFAQTQGIIETVFAGNADHVRQGDPLIRLRSFDLEFEKTRLLGELETVRQQIEDLGTLRGDPRRTGTGSASLQELAARSEELKTVQASLKMQLDVVGRRLEALTLTSPIDGQVLTWDVEQLLSGRPVERSDRLVTIAEVNGPWIVEAAIDPRDTGPVIEALAQGRIRLTLVTAEAPDYPIEAKHPELAPALLPDPTRGMTLILTADIVSDPGSRPGTVVSYRVECGRASLIRVWFRRLIDRLTSWWTLL